MNKLIFFLLIFFSINTLPAKQIDFIGLEKLTKEDLSSITNIDLSQSNFSLNEINKIILSLYNSDLIYDVSYKENEDSYIIEIKENKFINKVFFNNNDWIQDKLLYEIINSQNNQLISKNKISNDIRLIKSIYKSKGFNFISVTAKTEYFSKDKVNLIYDIYEGQQSKINLIKFYGNKSFSDRYLSSKITSRQLNFYNFFKSGSNINAEVFEFDANKIKKFYRDLGYFDVDVSYVLESNNLNLFSLNFYINEGKQYKINNINYDINIQSLGFFEDLEKDFYQLLKKNDFKYDSEYLKIYLEKINQSLLDHNIFTYYVDLKTTINDSFVDLVFIETAQEPLIVNKIDIYGNSITKDKTIRSKILLEPGDYINQYLLDSSISNLNKFSYINNVKYETIIDENNNSNLSIEIDESKKTGNLLLAGTYNTDTSLGLTLGLEDKNFLGSGNILDANINLNSEDVKFDISYTNFSIKNPYLSNTYTIYNQQNDFTSSYGYKSIKQGLGYSINFSDVKNLRYGAGLSYEYNKGYAPKNSNIEAINDNIGEFNNVIINFSITKDTTNDIFRPTKGHFNKLSFKISPHTISDDDYFKVSYSNRNYFKLANSENYFFLNNNLGYADSLNSKLKTINTFSLGGNNFKGFDFRGIGPVSEDIYLGGNQYLTSTLGYGSSFLFDEKDNIDIKLFLTAGSIWQNDYTEYDYKIRSSAGISLDFITAIGPISFTYAKPISKDTLDNERDFTFSIGTSF